MTEKISGKTTEKTIETPFDGVIYSFEKVVKTGFGAKIHDVCMAYHYAKRYGKDLYLVKGEPWHSLVGYNVAYHQELAERSADTNPLFHKTKNGWHYVFSSLKNVITPEVLAKNPDKVWPNVPYGGWTPEPPETWKGQKQGWYHRLMRKLFILNNAHKTAVDTLMADIPSTPIVLHLRLTDKINPTPYTTVESAEVDLEWYLDEVRNIASTKLKEMEPKVFVCTDDNAVIELIKSTLAPNNIAVVWDDKEVRKEAFTTTLFSEKASASETLAEMVTFLKNVKIMAQAPHLVGARSSYIFRIADMLRYPKPTYNVKDNDVFGVAPYLPATTKMVRASRIKAFPRFVNKSVLNASRKQLKTYRETLKRDGILEIPNFLDPQTAEELHSLLGQLPNTWLTQAIKYGEETTYYPLSQGVSEENDNAKAWMTKGNFAYCFNRSMGLHYETCRCAVCKLTDSVNSYQFLDTVNNLTKENFTTTNETFLSRYSRGDFLSTHHDQNKGKYAFVLSLTKDWRPEYGGLLHFVKGRNIYRTEVPTFNTFIIFSIPQDLSIRRDHFVSEVVVDHQTRTSFTGWV